MNVLLTRARVVAWLPALLLAVVTLASPGFSAPRVAGSLDFAPKTFYGGQAVTFQGDLGAGGRRQVWLEFHMGRRGDTWTRIPGFSTYTDSAGRFSFSQPARGMRNIRLRVASRDVATPSVLFQARDQAIAISVLPQDSRLQESLLPLGLYEQHTRYGAAAGEPYVVRVDTSPYDSPILVGRRVVLQQRLTADRWQTIGAGAVDRNGHVDFSFTRPVTGTVVYRAQQGDWTQGGSRVGWFPSFPTTLDILHRPSPVSGLKVTDVDPSEIDLAWTPSSDPAAYQVWVAWNKGTTAPSSLTRVAGKAALSPGASTYTIRGLTPSTGYAIAVFARTSKGVLSTRQAVLTKTEAKPR